MIALSDRLQLIANKIVKGSRLADIGSDHALLPVYLASQEVISFAVAGELNAGPLSAAQNQVELAGMAHKIQVRHGDGLAVIQPGEVDAITIAGMGGALITRILDEGKDKLAGVKQLVLQPNVGEDIVRRWLFKHDWVLIEEDIVLEDHKIYEVLHAVRVEEAERINEELYDTDRWHGKLCEVERSDDELRDRAMLDRDDLFRFGPWLLKQRDAVFFMKWEREIAKLEKVCSKLSKSTLEQSKQRLKSFEDDIAKIREVLTCLQKVKLSRNGSSS